MGNFDGAEICELKGLSIQSNLETILPKTDFGLYRDDGYFFLRNLNGQQMGKKRKPSSKFSKTLVLVFIFKQITNLKEVNFLDVTLNLQNGTYRPYKKPKDKLLYTHPLIIKQFTANH